MSWGSQNSHRCSAKDEFTNKRCRGYKHEETVQHGMTIMELELISTLSTCTPQTCLERTVECVDRSVEVITQPGTEIETGNRVVKITREVQHGGSTSEAVLE